MSAVAVCWLAIQVAILSLLGTGLFLWMRRRGPSAAAACAATVLMLTLPLVLVAFSPWPRWELRSKTISPPAEIPTEQTATPVKIGPPDWELAASAAASEPASESPLAALWSTALEMLPTPEPAVEKVATPQRATWRTWLPWIVAAGIGLGIVRLLVGVWAVRKLRRCSKVVDDPSLGKLIDEIVQQIICWAAAASRRFSFPSFKLEVRETAKLRSAATIGWRRPVLLLPLDWRTWTETERRIVIAHELAHIARHDYLLVLIARLVTAIHFYQPLVLWLARQLHVQQELATDVWTANLTGSRQIYLTTLAQMALRADDKPMPWTARAFLPGPGLLVKRITWLKRNHTKEAETMNRRSRWILVGTMAAIALLVAGIRGPNETVLAANATDPAAEKAEDARKLTDGRLRENSEAAKAGAEAAQLAQAAANQAPPQANLTLEFARVRTTKYIPGDANLIIVVSPSELAKSPSVAKVLEAIRDDNFGQKLGINPAEIEDVELMQINRGFDRVVLRSVKPFDWKTLANSLAPNAKARKSENGKEYFVSETVTQSGLGNCYFSPDDRTIVIATEPEIKKIIAGEKPEKNAGLDATALEVQVKTEFLRKWTGAWNPQREAENMLLASVMPLFEQTEVFTLSGIVAPNSGSPTEKNSNEKIMLALSMTCKSEAATKAVADTLLAVRILSKNYTASAGKIIPLMKAAEKESEIDKNQVLVAEETLKIYTKLVENTKIDSSTNPNIVNVITDAELPKDVVANRILPAIVTSRDAAARNMSAGNMKEILLGFHNVEDKSKHLPANILDKNGKPLLSWRVALLPEVEEEKLYHLFHLDEPWDSEHNLKLLQWIPAVYRNPKDKPSSTNASYFKPDGKGTIGRAKSLGDLSDGTAATIALVEAKRDIPWTKPEDIEIDLDSNKPLPQLGGFFGGTFNVGFADAHVNTISDAQDPALLRKFFTIAGGERVNEAELKPPAIEKNAALNRKPAANDGAATAARQKENIINLKKIGFALHNYASAYRHFPPPVLLGSDGKTKCSWRVLVLPFIDGHTVKTKYRFDEPWDSENNLKVLGEMPAAFRSPFDAADSTNTSYFMVTGKGTFGDNEEGRFSEGEDRKVQEITDGMANTIMLVEAKRGVPWTKPEDIEIAADRPLPKFGGFLPNGLFNASFADGSVRTVSSGLDEKILRALFSIDGGEIVDMKALVPPSIEEGGLRK